MEVSKANHTENKGQPFTPQMMGKANTFVLFDTFNLVFKIYGFFTAIKSSSFFLWTPSIQLHFKLFSNPQFDSFFFFLFIYLSVLSLMFGQILRAVDTRLRETLTKNLSREAGSRKGNVWLGVAGKPSRRLLFSYTVKQSQETLRLKHWIHCIMMKRKTTFMGWQGKFYCCLAFCCSANLWTQRFTAHEKS